MLKIKSNNMSKYKPVVIILDGVEYSAKTIAPLIKDKSYHVIVKYIKEGNVMGIHSLESFCKFCDDNVLRVQNEAKTLVYKGKKITYRQAAKIAGVSYGTIYERAKRMEKDKSFTVKNVIAPAHHYRALLAKKRAKKVKRTPTQERERKLRDIPEPTAWEREHMLGDGGVVGKSTESNYRIAL